jgi:hypothetical protein
MAFYNYDRYAINSVTMYKYDAYNLTPENTRGTLYYLGFATDNNSGWPSNGIAYGSTGRFPFDSNYWLVYSHTYQDRRRGSYVDTIQAEDGTYPDNGASGSYWYVKRDLANVGPSISGSDLDLGAKVSNFQIEYIVTDPDAGDAVTVEIKVNNTITQPHTATSLGVKRFIDVDITEYALGKHTVTITAKDRAGLTATRIYTFTKTNTAPEISGVDTDLGAKNTPFSVVYQVKDKEKDSVTVFEKLNGTVIKTLNNVTLETDLTITIDDEILQSLEIGKTNTIEIEARDGKGGIAYRRYEFKRTNYPPIISGVDSDLGEFETEFSYTWSATDVEGDEMTAEVFFNGVMIKESHAIVDNAEQSISFVGFEFLKIKPGKHTIRIVVTDDKGGKSERIVSFTRVARRLIMQQQDVYETDVAAQRILVVPNSRVALGAIEKIEVTNNGFDENPTWEDATSMVKAGKAYNFQNTVKTSDTWGIDTRLQIDREDAPALQSWIAGWGISYE